MKAAWSGIRLAAVVFILTSLFRALPAGEESFASGIGMARMCLATLVIGVGFGVPSLIYATELPTGLKVLIHMGIGVVVMLAASLAVGWIDFSRGWLPCLLVALVQIAVAFLIWLLSCVRLRKDAKEMNERVAEKE
jgi:hypothetical protein